MDTNAKKPNVLRIEGVAVRFCAEPSGGVKEIIIDILTSAYEEKMIEELESAE